MRTSVYPEPLDIKSGYFAHDLPDHLAEQFEQTKLIPKGYVVLSISRPIYLQQLVAEDQLTVIDRYFSRGDVVKKNPLDAQSGTVIGSSVVCSVSPSFSVTKSGGNFLTHTDFIEVKAPPISNVGMQELVPLHKWCEGDTIIYDDWLGIIRDVQHEITVKIDGGGVVVVDHDEDVDEVVRTSAPPSSRYGGHRRPNTDGEIRIPAHPFYYGQKVRIPRELLRRSRWIKGSYKRRTELEGVVLEVKVLAVEVDWKLPKTSIAEARTTNHASHQDESSTSTHVEPDPKPDVYLLVEALESGAVKLCDQSRHLKGSDSSQSLVVAHPWVTAGENVKFKDIALAKSKYGCHMADNQRRTLFSMRSTWKAPMEELIMAHVISTASTITVRWQDNSVTDECARSICPYDEVDDHDVWPGELVSLKDQEDSYQDPSFERLIRTRSIGVVQSVNADERIALVRWFEGADVTITGENHDQLVTSHSTLGRITDRITEIAVFEIRAHQAIARRRGDLVCIPPLHSSSQTLSSDTTGPPTSSVTVPADNQWCGEIVDLLLDGQVLVRLDGAEDIQDVSCSVLDIKVAASADDDTTESGSFTDSMDTDESDEKDLWIPDHSPTQGVISTTVEYEGSAPIDPAIDGEDQWMTDSDSDIRGDSQESSSQELPASATGSFESAEDQKMGPPHEPDARDRPNQECADFGVDDGFRQEAGLQPAPFDVLEGPCPGHTFGAKSEGSSGKWLKAVAREHQILRSALPDGVYVRTWETSMEFVRVLIVGPSGTPFALAPFLFDIYLSPQFPYQAPSAFFHSWTNGIGRVNPNLYEDGKVCLSLLGTWFSEKDDEEWVPFTSSILQIIVSLLGLVLVKEPFYNEAGYEALQGTAKTKHTSALYSEKAFVLSRGFVARALEDLPAGVADVIQWLYLPVPHGPCMLHTITEDCNIILQAGASGSSEEDSHALQKHLEKYYITSPKLSQGVLMLLKKVMPRLESLLSKHNKPAALGPQAPVET
ncbi:MAG: hypothetical protein LQ344_003717 [Seirophora lacunosa]|nr:MAG: hypothetical protein LQ344_003717 [Seirophora lacunosa]